MIRILIVFALLLPLSLCEEVLSVDGVVHAELSGDPPQGRPIKVLGLAGGSRGDTQPLVSIFSYMRLQDPSLECVLGAGKESQHLIESIGCEFFALDIDWKELLQTDQELTDAILTEDIHVIAKAFGKVEANEYAHIPTVFEKHQFDAAMSTSLVWATSFSITERYHIPSFMVILQELVFSPDSLSAFFDPEAVSFDSAQESWDYYEATWEYMADTNYPRIRRGRKEHLNLERELMVEDIFAAINGVHPAVTSLFTYSKYAASYEVSEENHLPEPLGFLYQPDLGDAHSEFGVKQEIVDFFAAGAAPIYLGWGSMCTGLSDTPRLSKVVVEALKLSGKRGIVYRGWQELSIDALEDDDLVQYAKENVLFLEKVPHHYVLPRCEALMIHGGSGTTAAALRSGRPVIVSPYLVDQPWWAELIKRKGVGVRVSNVIRITSSELAEAIVRVTEDKEMVERAKQFGELVRAEQGLEKVWQTVKSSVEDFRNNGLKEIDWSMLTSTDFTKIGLSTKFEEYNRRSLEEEERLVAERQREKEEKEREAEVEGEESESEEVEEKEEKKEKHAKKEKEKEKVKIEKEEKEKLKKEKEEKEPDDDDDDDN